MRGKFGFQPDEFFNSSQVEIKKKKKRRDRGCRRSQRHLLVISYFNYPRARVQPRQHVSR